jgi:hypothetical protein
LSISSVLLKFGLAFAVHDLCEKYSNSEIQFISDDNGIKRYNQEFEIKIYNIIEELINNRNSKYGRWLYEIKDANYCDVTRLTYLINNSLNTMNHYKPDNSPKT